MCRYRARVPDRFDNACRPQNGLVADNAARNPARQIETLAAAMVGDWVGTAGTVVNTGSGHGPDFRIDYSDGRLGWGEVGWHEDPAEQAMWAETFRRDRHQIIELPGGRGHWSLSLRRGAHIGRLFDEVPTFIDRLLKSGQLYLEVVEDWPRTPEADEARRLGIEHIERVNTNEPALAVYFMPGSGGMVPEDPDVIVDWIEGVLGDPNYRDTTTKLLRLECAERHVFLMSGSRTDFGADERLRRIDAALPRRPPHLPSGITHVWAVSRFGSAGAALWSSVTGWMVVPAPRRGTED